MVSLFNEVALESNSTKFIIHSSHKSNMAAKIHGKKLIRRCDGYYSYIYIHTFYLSDTLINLN